MLLYISTYPFSWLFTLLFLAQSLNNDAYYMIHNIWWTFKTCRYDMISICIAVKIELRLESTCAVVTKRNRRCPHFPANMLAQRKQKGPYDSTLFIPSLTLYTSRCKKTRWKITWGTKADSYDSMTLKSK